MPYSQFKIADLRRVFGIKDSRKRLFDTIEPLEPSSWLLHTLSFRDKLPLNYEKAKSEWIIAPILTDDWEQCDQCFNIHSGVNLEADIPQGLNGECDFILTADPEKSYFLKSPIFTIVEAKRDDFLGGVPQCVAQMLGAKRFNELDGVDLPIIYGCVTDGMEWLFLRLENHSLVIDEIKYISTDLPLLLGVLKKIVVKSVT